MKYLWRKALLAIVFFGIAHDVNSGIASTKHNLSASGSGTIRAVSEQDICIFCHIPHNFNPRGSSWNRSTEGGYYTPYTSSTAESFPGQPNGASVLCLSCHDGTIALGDVISEETPIPMLGGVTTMVPGPSVLGTDLSDDHPISFDYTWSLASKRRDLVQPNELTGTVKLDSWGRMQCTSCHDPHEDKNGKFLTVNNRQGALCTTCHKNIPYWNQSSHGTSTVSLAGTDSQYLTVAENACANCHQPHNAGGRERLMKYAGEEQNCLRCHDGTIAKTDIASSLRKISNHPVYSTTGEHNPAEAYVPASRHVECEDCHNPHAVNSSFGLPSGLLLGVRGITINGTEVESARNEYEICFRCHGDGFNMPAPKTPRQIEQMDTRKEFSLGNPSYHPIAGTGNNQDVPSLLLPYNINSIIKCSDCHGDDNSTAMGGSGPRGVHGSNFPSLLQLQYETLDNTPESPTAYALCYKCHDRDSLLSDQSFKSHRLHIVDERTSCNTCHDPHGISFIQGNSLNNSSLINFDISIVKPNSTGNLRYEATGRFSGTCYLKCHDSDHAPKSY